MESMGADHGIEAREVGGFHFVACLVAVCTFCLQLVEAVHFLHELGSLQHFDQHLLRDRVVINPQWIVDVMACVVSVHTTVIQVS